ncbi:D-alanine--D-alanine ligase [Flavobacterium sp. MC2016-06]|uniref:D-alanine--D-alanine ligase n=1 Tax=Flavobacterium sp. MC2016-06 TaxID=2676308 RepID=UPI0012BA5858|nr:D-alanine--D-alanine ligase [Flavobacterium sp. MC2016-06]MBU3858524.1 D-alanine--D-alanine ligase [Flavobacterium sp. MC2016-06]
MKLFFHKIANWEYWPFQVVYIPIYFLWAYYAIKARSIFFFNASNPKIKNGGFLMESKKQIYDSLPKEYYPKTILIKENTALKKIVQEVVEKGIYFPLIAKPDIGLRGSGVKKIHTVSELINYVEKANFDFLLQDLISFKNEVGIFYVRHPNEKEGRITGIVAKEFLIVIGDGISTIETLIKKTPRFRLQLEALEQEYGDLLKQTLPKGESINLVPFGNHARGAKFIDGSHWITPKLTQTINEICSQIPEFYFGRFDIMYNSFEELERGENFQIVELNGAASEPTHIYDPKHSIWFAWKELARHITYMYEISAANHKRGIPYLDYKVGMNEYRLHLAQNNKILNF